MNTRLNLGCSNQILEGWVNVDCRQLPGVDRVVDLDATPWPWLDRSVDEIFMAHCLEHVKDPLAALRECRRVLKVGGKIIVKVPHASGRLAYFPGHYTQFSSDWFLALSDSGNCQFGLDEMWTEQTTRMSLLHHQLVNLQGWRWSVRMFVRIWDWFWNRTPAHHITWEMIGILPPTEITWTAVKK